MPVDSYHCPIVGLQGDQYESLAESFTHRDAQCIARWYVSH
eukprot:COSAG02_NODE_44034_length_369_cov_1.144444_1_plen_40_part_01